MEIQVSGYTVSRVENQYAEREFITRKDLPDLDCVYVGNHLKRQLHHLGGYTINFKSMTIRVMECFGVLYNHSEYNTRLLMNRLKKIKA